MEPGKVKADMQLAAAELEKNGKFNVGGVLNTKLKKTPATPSGSFHEGTLCLQG